MKDIPLDTDPSEEHEDDNSQLDCGDSDVAARDRRKFAIKKKPFVRTTFVQSVLAQMETLVQAPKNDRMVCMLLLGDPNSGKTSLLKKFAQSHPRFRDPRSESDRLPVLHFLLGSGTEASFYVAGLKAMSVKVAVSHNLQQRQHQFLDNCSTLGVKVLAVDEFHNGADGSAMQQDKFLTMIRHVTNVLRIPLLCGGTDDVLSFISSDPQLSSRFFLRRKIPLWQDGPEYRGFLKKLEQHYQLKRPSNLAVKDDLAEKILELSEHLTGDMVQLLEFAAIKAIETGTEQITVELLDSLVESMEWTRPSERMDTQIKDVPSN